MYTLCAFLLHLFLLISPLLIISPLSPAASDGKVPEGEEEEEKGRQGREELTERGEEHLEGREEVDMFSQGSHEILAEFKPDGVRPGELDGVHDEEIKTDKEDLGEKLAGVADDRGRTSTLDNESIAGYRGTVKSDVKEGGVAAEMQSESHEEL